MNLVVKNNLKHIVMNASLGRDSQEKKFVEKLVEKFVEMEI